MVFPFLMSPIFLFVLFVPLVIVATEDKSVDAFRNVSAREASKVSKRSGGTAESNRDTVHITAESTGYVGPPLGIGFVPREKGYRLYYHFSSDLQPQGRLWQVIKSIDGVRWKSPDNFTVESDLVQPLGMILVGDAKDLSGYDAVGLLYAHPMCATLFPPCPPPDLEIVASDRTKSQARALELYLTGTDGALFVYDGNLFAVSFDLENVGLQCGFGIMQLISLGAGRFAWNKTPNKCVYNLFSALQGCRSPQIISVGGEWFIVFSAKDPNSPLRAKSMYARISLRKGDSKTCFQIEASRVYDLDGGSDGVDYKFGVSSMSTILGIGWLGNDYPDGAFSADVDEKWRFGLTSLRDIQSVGGKLRQSLRPSWLKDLGRCCTPQHIVANDQPIEVKSGSRLAEKCAVLLDFDAACCPFEDGSAYQFSLNFKLDLKASSIGISFYNDADEAVTLSLNPTFQVAAASMSLQVDRGKSKLSPQPSTTKFPLVGDNGLTGSFVMLLDRGSLEVFANDGEYTMTSLYRNAAGPFKHLCITAASSDGRTGTGNRLLSTSKCQKLHSISEPNNAPCKTPEPTPADSNACSWGITGLLLGSVLVFSTSL